MTRAIDSPSERASRLSFALPFIVVVGVVCSVGAFWLFDRSESRLTDAAFETASQERLLAIEERLDESIDALEDLSSLYAVLGEVSSEAFTSVVEPILSRNPALRGISWNPVITDENRDAHEAAARSSGLDGYQIVERNEAGELVRAETREQYVVVSAIAPPDGNERAIGFDVSSEPTRREAIDTARDTGDPAIATPIELVQDGEDSAGALAFVPHFRPGAPTQTIEDRRASLVGYFVTIVDIDDTIAAALVNFDDVDIDVTIIDSSTDADNEILYPSNLETTSLGLQTEATFQWGDRQLNVRFVEGPSFGDPFRNVVPLGTLFGGLLVTFLLAALFASLHSRADRIERVVAKRTGELRDANLGLEAEIGRRTNAERALEAYRDDLERQVGERTSELEYTTKQLRAIVDSEPECVKLVDADGLLVDMNPAGLRMIEAESFDQVRGLCVYDLVADADRHAFIELNERVMSGEAAALEFEIEGLKGTRRLMETHAVPLVATHGEPPLHLAITRDVTDRRRAERERLTLEAQLRQSQKLKSVGVLAGGIAHDFNNLLHVIVGNTEVAYESALNDERSLRALETSQAAASEAAKLCDQMLTYAGESRPDVEPVALSTIVCSMVELLAVSHTKKVGLSIEMDEGGPAIEGDSAQLGQVVVNMVTNASQAIGEETGMIRVCVDRFDVDAIAEDEVWLDSAPPPGRYVALSVTDDGAGMTADELEMIFDPFYTTKFAGRGLGLSSTLGIVRSHSGHLRVTSEIGVGSTFTVLFPASNAAVPGATESAAPDQDEFHGTVLLVDDEPQILQVATGLLESFGLTVHTAGDGEAALRAFEEHGDDIDIAILDVTMPKLGGTETSIGLRRRRPDLPIVFCSGYAAAVTDESLPGVGFTSFLHKPYRRADLISTLRDADRASGWSTDHAPASV